MNLTSVWVQTLADGLIRADLIAGIHTHRTPAVAGKPPRWLLDVVLSSTTGSGQAGSWTVSPLHRTLTQTADEPTDAPQQLARLLAQLEATVTAGIITTSTSPEASSPDRTAESDTATTMVRFRFTPFAAVQAGDQYDSEYL
ncbi:MAG: hypothetical protein QOG76_2152 [Pseudonocardiales bacterium]|nr:hypothetical protein [Pseudonocardiales bacterium]